jgi:hypothetical protein
MATADSWRAASRVLEPAVLEEFALRVACGLPEEDMQLALLLRTVPAVDPTRALFRDDRGVTHPFIPYAPMRDPAALFARVR